MYIKPLPQSHIIFWLLDMSNKQEKKITVENYTTIEMISLKIDHKIQTYGVDFSKIETICFRGKRKYDICIF